MNSWISLILLPYLLLGPNAAEGSGVAVVYPQTRAPYNEVFERIIRGIQSQAGASISLYPVSEPDQASLTRQLAAQQPELVIVLGNLQLEYQTLAPAPVLLGAVAQVPSSLSGVSMSCDPQIMLQRLKTISPQVKRVFLLYQPMENGWLIPRAQQAAQQQGLELITRPVTDLRTAVLEYQKFFQTAVRHQDAVWLPLDSIATNTSLVLPLVLKQTWDRELVLFSNSPAMVRRGALFSFYPDNEGMGRQLVELGSQLAPESPPQQQPTLAMKMAINMRTAKHLGMQLSAETLARIDLVLPER